MERPVVRVLGPIRFPGRTAESVEPSGAMPRRLLAALALAGAEGRGIAGLTDDLWGDEPPRNPRGAIQMLVSRIRATAADGVVASTASGYRVADSDLRIAEDAAADGAEAALALWSGSPGADLEDGDLADDLAARAERARVRLLRLLADRLLAEERPADAVTVLTQLVAAAPLDGGPVGSLMRALAASGRTDSALAAFAAHREAMAEALGADPDPDLARLNTELLRAQSDPPAGELVGVRAATTPLLGREHDLAALVSTVPFHRLTSIVGTGGLGKTRLAHEAAVGLAGRFERVVFTELAGTQAASDVELVVGAAVGARPQQRARRLGDAMPADLPTRTREVLAARRTLLILDNCEHVVDAAAALAADLLADVPGLTVLTTSRVPLLLPGEAVVAPAPLPPGSAASELFVARATSARPGVALDPDLVERVCGRLDGLPLAIELAAARLRSMTLTELDARLTDRFAVLVGGDRAAPDRHRTLLAVIEWSRRLLSPAAADALATLAVFPDGFSPDAARTVLDADPAAVLTELVDQSLLGFAEPTAGRSRYRMLETVREFGLRDLAEHGRLAEARAALDRWALAFARRSAPDLIAGRDPAAAQRVGEEEETLLGVLHAAPAGGSVATAVAALLAEYWVYRGEFESIVGLIPVLLAAGSDRSRTAEETAESVRALALGASIAMVTGRADAPRALALLRRMLAGGAAPDGFWQVFAANLLLARDRGAGLDALERLTADADPLVSAFALLMRAQLAENSGRTAEALVDLAAAEDLARRSGFTWFRYLARTSTASLLSQRGDHARALAAARTVRREILELGVDTDPRQLDWLIGSNAVATGELDEAERIFTAMARFTGRSGPTDEADNRALAIAGLAEVAHARGDRVRALALWREAVDARGRSSSPWRIILDAGALAAGVAFGAPEQELERQYRRLRALLLAVQRIQAAFVDSPVVGAGLLGLSTVLRRSDPGAADELVGVALAMGARRDLRSLDLAARSGSPVPFAGQDVGGRATELLRSPAVRRR